MKRLSVIIAALLGCVVALPSCDPTDPSNSSGLPRSAKAGTLTPAEAVQLCDWTNQRQGGYGRNVTCTGAGNQMTDPDQATCAGGIPDLATRCPTLTVGDIEDCTNAVQMDLCTYPTVAACAAVRACFGT